MHARFIKEFPGFFLYYGYFYSLSYAFPILFNIENPLDNMKYKI